MLAFQNPHLRLADVVQQTQGTETAKIPSLPIFCAQTSVQKLMGVAKTPPLRTRTLTSLFEFYAFRQEKKQETSGRGNLCKSENANFCIVTNMLYVELLTSTTV